MKLLLDTCVVLWMAGEPERLSSKVRRLLCSPDTERWFSASSCFEIAVKSRKGKLELPLPAPDWIREARSAYGLRELPMTSEIAALAPAVSVPHADPCDRIIVATARIHRMGIVTPDTSIRACREIEVLW